jgi:GDP-4-dehydro-6-deoxy-D-mannose reductase
VNGKRVLITGVGGFAGRHLAALCAAEGAILIGSGRRETTDVELASYIRGDLTDAVEAGEVVREAAPERIFHLAAEASVAHSWQDPAGVIAANVASTLNLLEAARLYAPSARLLVACSGEEYGPPERLPVGEDHPLRPQNPYALSKAAVDLAAGFYADAHGLEIVRTRAFNHAGPGQSDTYVVSSFARQIAEAEAAGSSEVEIVTGNLAPRRDFTDVRDVVRAYRLALARAEPGACNVCSGRSSAIGDILAALSRHTTLAVGQRTDPSLLRENEVMDIRGSHEKLTAATGWQPEIPLERTLRDTLDWWRERVGAKVTR